MGRESGSSKYGVAWEESLGFRECDSSCLSRNSRKLLFEDFPILTRIRPILTGMRRLDQVAFGAELLEMGYSIAKVRYGCGLSITTIIKLRDRMKTLGMIPECCGCGRPLGHKGWCRYLLAMWGPRKIHSGCFSATNQPKTLGREAQNLAVTSIADRERMPLSGD